MIIIFLRNRIQESKGVFFLKKSFKAIGQLLCITFLRKNKVNLDEYVSIYVYTIYTQKANF